LELNDPYARTEERFRPDGWFATGDEYLQDTDGFYHHRGRTGDMLRVSGIWISPAEIEDVLAGIRSISETAAVLGESEIGLAEIVLYIVPAPGADGSAAVAASELGHAICDLIADGLARRRSSIAAIGTTRPRAVGTLSGPPNRLILPALR
jgi:acyl-coenzyme A synthetase/AMP-(fatty) acid ligase